MSPSEQQGVLGVFVGGAARRLGGVAKGLLPTPATGEPIVALHVRCARALGLVPVLVGAAEAYRSFAAASRVLMLEDDPAGVGPLGGLGALLAFAGERFALALGGDMPWVTPTALEPLVRYAGAAAVLAPRSGAQGLHEPLFARYDAPRVRPALAHALARGVRSFQGLLALLTVEELVLADDARGPLRDWDRPEDLPAEVRAVLASGPLREPGRPPGPLGNAPPRRGRGGGG